MTSLIRMTRPQVEKEAKKYPGRIVARDADDGSYWSLQGRQWTPLGKGTDGPSNALELPDGTLPTNIRDLPKRPPNGKDVVQELERIMEWWRKLFADGVVSSGQADRFAARTVLLDEEGGVWAVGIRTGTWYHFDRKWQAVDAPAPDSIVAPQNAIEADDPTVRDGLAHFLKHAKSTAPETITDAWEPTKH